MSTALVKLTAEIVSSHATGSSMSSDDLLLEIEKVFSTLKQLETGEAVTAAAEVQVGPAMTMKMAFKKDQVGCMICGKTGFKTLTRHLKKAHDLKPGAYRKQFNIPSSQSLTAKNYSEARRKAATENNLASNLVKARAARMAKNAPAILAEPVATEENGKTTKAAKVAKSAKVAKVSPKAKAAKGA